MVGFWRSRTALHHPQPKYMMGLGEDWIASHIVGALETGVTGTVIEMGRCFGILHIL